MTELKPCPFCGNKQPRILTFAEHYRLPMYRGQRAIECSCGAFVRGAGNEAAIAAWNRRADNELPEHGDLIDRVAFRAEMDKHYPFDHGTQRRHGEADEAKSTIINMLANAPVIVPSNKEETE